MTRLNVVQVSPGAGLTSFIGAISTQDGEACTLNGWSEPTATPGMPSSFIGTARIAGSLSDNVNASVAYMTDNTAISQGALVGAVTYPADATQKSVSVGVKLNPADRVGNSFVTYKTPTFTAPLPASAFITAQVIGTAKSPNAAGVAEQVQVMSWKSNVKTSDNVTIAFPSAPSLTSPVNGAAVKATDTFTWTGGTAPYRLDIDCKGYKASIVTNATDAALPTGLGSWPAAATDCTASVTSYSSATTIDSTVVADAPFKTTSPWAADGTMATVTNAFTSAP